jgi:tetratricopeptide (TPR) repeat protein
MRESLRALVTAAFVLSPAALHGQDLPAHRDAGVAAREARDPKLALEHFRAALSMDSLDYVSNWASALALIDLGKVTPDSVPSTERDSLYALAEVHGRRAVAARPDGADGHFALALAIGRAALTKSKKERVRRAVEIREEALRTIRLDPTHDGGHHVLGRWHAEVMRLSSIQRFFAKAFLGGGELGKASWDEAIGNMEKAVELNPRRIYHRLDLAEIYVDRKRYADARAQLEAIPDLPLLDHGDETYQADAAALLERIRARGD